MKARQLATGYLQSFYYSLTIRAGDPKPAPGSPRHVRDRGRIHILVLATYLLYTLYEAHWEIQRAGDFYKILGVSHDVDEKTLQSRFRRLTLQYHPDKVADPRLVDSAEAFYVQLKLARDTLLDPAKRFAYDRFGPDVTDWRHCVKTHDFVMQGLRNGLPFYTASAVLMLVFGYLGFFDWGQYWRYLVFVSLAVFELRTVTRPDSVSLVPYSIWAWLQSAGLAQYLPYGYLPFQTLRLAHKAVLAFFIALSRLGPLLQQLQGAAATGTEEQKLNQQLQRLEQTAMMTGVESTRLLALEMVPFKSEPGTTQVRERLKEWMVQNTIRSRPDVQAAVARVYERRQRHVQEVDE